MKRTPTSKKSFLWLVVLLTISAYISGQSHANGWPIQLLEPPDGAVNVQSWQNLRWAEDGVCFYVDISTDPSFPSYPEDVWGYNSLSLSGLYLSEGATYYWRVSGWCEYWNEETGTFEMAWYDTSPTWSFTMGDEVEPLPHIELNTDEVHFYAIENGPSPDPQTLTITNTGGGVLYWSVSEWVDWLERDPVSGASNFAEIELGVNTTSLPPGVYEGTVRVSGSCADNNYQFVTIEYTVDEATGIAEAELSALPKSIQLSQNYPNPFNPITEIEFTLPRACNAKLEIFNIMGQKVTTLVDRPLNAGCHRVRWDGSNEASGVYTYRLQAGEHLESKKMLLVK